MRQTPLSQNTAFICIMSKMYWKTGFLAEWEVKLVLYCMGWLNGEEQLVRTSDSRFKTQEICCHLQEKKTHGLHSNEIHIQHNKRKIRVKWKAMTEEQIIYALRQTGSVRMKLGGSLSMKSLSPFSTQSTDWGRSFCPLHCSDFAATSVSQSCRCCQLRLFLSLLLSILSFQCRIDATLRLHVQLQFSSHPALVTLSSSKVQLHISSIQIFSHCSSSPPVSRFHWWDIPV